MKLIERMRHCRKQHFKPLPLIAADMAKAIPVFPLVASMRVSPGCMSPAFSASEIMLMAGLQQKSCRETNKAAQVEAC